MLKDKGILNKDLFWINALSLHNDILLEKSLVHICKYYRHDRRTQRLSIEYLMECDPVKRDLRDGTLSLRELSKRIRLFFLGSNMILTGIDLRL